MYCCSLLELMCKVKPLVVLGRERKRKGRTFEWDLVRRHNSNYVPLIDALALSCQHFQTQPLTFTLVFSCFIIEGNDVGKVVVAVEVARGILGNVVVP